MGSGNEIKTPHFANSLLKRMSVYNDRHSILYDFEETFYEIMEDEGAFKAKCWYWINAITTYLEFLKLKCLRGLIMFFTYLKTALRNIRRHKKYSIINITGLSIGMCCCIIILLYVKFELSYDNYHKDGSRVYRIPIKKETKSRKVAWPTNTAALIPVLRDKFTQVEFAGRLTFDNFVTVKYKDKIYYENNVAWGDQDIFNILTIGFLHGDRLTALTNPNTVVLTKSTAEKYFRGENPVGKSININNRDMKITGIIVDSPQNTHIKFNIIVSLLSQKDQWWMTHWPTAMCYTYIKLAPGVEVDKFEKQIADLADNYSIESKRRGEKITFSLQPVKDIHLYSHLDFEKESPGSVLYLFIFCTSGILILLISCSNYINLTSARFSNRSKEVGIRKVAGACRAQLFAQLVCESVTISLAALIIAVITAKLLIPYVNSLVGAKLEIRNLINFSDISGIIVFTVITGLAAGSYPAFITSSLKPAALIRNISLFSGNRIFIRKMLVTGQFVISIFLIIGSITVYRQIGYMKYSDPGFDKQQKLVLQFPAESVFTNRLETVKEEFGKHPSITGAAASSSIPGRRLSTSRIFPSGERAAKSMSIKFLRIDHDFLQLYKIKMAAGRPFSKEMKSDRFLGSIIINESMARLNGWYNPEEAIGKTFYDPPRPVVGVTEDFNFQGLQRSIEPLYMNIWPEKFAYFTLALDIKNLSSALSFIKVKHLELFPDIPFNYFFLDSAFEDLYQFEEKVSRVFGIFSLIGILISCMGILGLAAYTAERRTKEIGIRKTLGASVSGILLLLSKDFIKCLVTGTLIAWPVSYFIMNKWLQSFAYHTNPGWIPFITASTLILITAIITVSLQILKSASANPVDSLKYE